MGVILTGISRIVCWDGRHKLEFGRRLGRPPHLGFTYDQAGPATVALPPSPARYHPYIPNLPSDATYSRS